MSIEYIQSSAALEAAERRLNNPELQGKVEMFLKEWPPGFEQIGEPMGVYAPYLAKGSITEVAAVDQAESAGLMPLIATYKQ